MEVYKKIFDEPVKTLNLRPLIAVPPDRSAGEVIDEMREKHLGCAIVVDADGRPLGAFTERVVTSLLHSGSLAMDEPVGNHLEERWTKVGLEDPVRRLLEAMNSERVRFACVTDAAGKAVALSGQKGLMEYLAEYFPQQVQRVVRRVGAEVIDVKREGA